MIWKTFFPLIILPNRKIGFPSQHSAMPHTPVGLKPDASCPINRGLASWMPQNRMGKLKENAPILANTSIALDPTTFRPIGSTTTSSTVSFTMSKPQRSNAAFGFQNM